MRRISKISLIFIAIFVIELSIAHTNAQTPSPEDYNYEVNGNYTNDALTYDYVEQYASNVSQYARLTEGVIHFSPYIHYLSYGGLELKEGWMTLYLKLNVNNFVDSGYLYGYFTSNPYYRIAGAYYACPKSANNLYFYISKIADGIFYFRFQNYFDIDNWYGTKREFLVYAQNLTYLEINLYFISGLFVPYLYDNTKALFTTNGMIDTSSFNFTYLGTSSYTEGEDTVSNNHYCWLGSAHYNDYYGISINADNWFSKPSNYPDGRSTYITFNNPDGCVNFIERIALARLLEQHSSVWTGSTAQAESLVGVSAISSYQEIQQTFEPVETLPSWNLIKFEIYDKENATITVGSFSFFSHMMYIADPWIVNFTIVDSRWVSEPFYYYDEVLDEDNYDWGIFNVIKHPIFYIINSLYIMLQFAQYLGYYVWNVVSGGVLWVIINVLYNKAIYYIYAGILWIVWYFYISVLTSFDFVKGWLYDNFSSLADYVKEGIVDSIEPVLNFVVDTILPILSEIIVNAFTLLESIVVYVLFMGQVDFATIFDNIEMINSNIFDFLTDITEGFFEVFPDIMLYVSFYFININLILLKMVYVKSKGYVNRYNALKNALDVYLLPIRIIQKGFESVEDFWGSLPVL